MTTANTTTTTGRPQIGERWASRGYARYVAGLHLAAMRNTDSTGLSVAALKSIEPSLWLTEAKRRCAGIYAQPLRNLMQYADISVRLDQRTTDVAVAVLAGKLKTAVAGRRAVVQRIENLESLPVAEGIRHVVGPHSTTTETHAHRLAKREADLGAARRELASIDAATELLKRLRCEHAWLPTVEELAVEMAEPPPEIPREQRTSYVGA